MQACSRNLENAFVQVCELKLLSSAECSFAPLKELAVTLIISK